MPDQQEAVAQLMELRSLTRMTGAIHEAQALQLKYWPRVAVPHATHSEVSFDVKDKGGPRSVYIDLTLDPRAKAPKDMKKRLETLEKNVKWLLGNDWRVVVKADGKIIHTGRRTVEPRPKAQRVKRRGRR